MVTTLQNKKSDDAAFITGQSIVVDDGQYHSLQMRPRIATSFNRGDAMTCKIERVHAPDGFVVLRVSGRIDGTQVETLRELTDKDKTTKGLAIDLTEVTLVSHEASRFLPLWRRAESNLKLSGPHT
jgi:hypothetical protein